MGEALELELSEPEDESCCGVGRVGVLFVGERPGKQLVRVEFDRGEREFGASLHPVEEGDGTIRKMR